MTYQNNWFFYNKSLPLDQQPKLPATVSYNANLTSRVETLFPIIEGGWRYTENREFRVTATNITGWQDATALQNALNAWKAYIPITFNSTSASNALMSISMVTDIEKGTYDPVTHQWTTTFEPGGVTFPKNTDGDREWEQVDIIIPLEGSEGTVKGTNTFQALLHELGHALGLGHPFLENDPFNSNPSYNHDNTVMAYRNGPIESLSQLGGVSLATPMTYDARYIQELYGVGTPTVNVPSYNPTSTNYAYGSATPLTGQKYAWTLWDTGGEDTLDASAVPNEGNVTVPLNVTLDLRGGANPVTDAPYFSFIGKEILSIAFDRTQFNTDGTLKPGKSGSGVVDIEIAKGGSGNDILIGGYAANTLEGGGGNDKVYDPSNKAISGDWLYGDTIGATLEGGNDTLWGGSNTFVYGGPAANDNYPPLHRICTVNAR